MCAFSHDGEWIYLADENVLERWSLKTGERTYSMVGHQDQIMAVSVSPNGQLFVTAARDGRVILCDARTGNKQHSLVLSRSLPTLSIAFSPDSKTLAIGKADGLVALWDVATGRELFSFQQHATGVDAIAFTPDGKTMMTACSNEDDSIVFLWTTQK